MVSGTIPEIIPDSTRGISDIKSYLGGLPDLGCSFGYGTTYVVVLGKPSNQYLPLVVPAKYAQVEATINAINKVTSSSDFNGVARACYLAAGTYSISIRVKHSDMDFGNGQGQWSNPKSVPRSITTPLGATFEKIIVLEGKYIAPCPSFRPQIGTSDFDKLTSRPSVFTQVSNINFSGYGIVPMNGNYTILINDKTIATGQVRNGKVDFTSIVPLSEISLGNVFGTTAKVTVTVDMGGCIFSNSTFVNIASLPKIPTPKLPSIPPPPSCSEVMTKIDSINHTQEITDFNMPFFVYLRDIKEVCKSDPTNPQFIKKLPKGTMGTITLGNKSTNFYLTDDGIANIPSLATIMNIQSLATQFPSGVTTPTVIQIPSTITGKRPCPAGSPTTRFKDVGTPLESVRAYLPLGYTAEVAEFGGTGTFKITRPNGSYFYAQSCNDIDKNIGA